MEPLIAHDLCIRPLFSKDAPAFAAAVRESVSTVGIWMPWCHENYSIDEANAWFESCERNLESRESYDFGVFTKTDDVILGGISINQLNRARNFGNIGYWVRQSCQRQGIAYRAAQTIAAFGFGQLKLTRLEIVAAERNIASRRVAEKLGGRLECIARNRLVIWGKPCTAAIYSLEPEQFNFQERVQDVLEK